MFSAAYFYRDGTLERVCVFGRGKNSEIKSGRPPAKCSIKMLVSLCGVGPRLQSEAVSKNLVTPNYKRCQNLKKDG